MVAFKLSLTLYIVPKKKLFFLGGYIVQVFMFMGMDPEMIKHYILDGKHGVEGQIGCQWRFSCSISFSAHMLCDLLWILDSPVLW